MQFRKIGDLEVSLLGLGTSRLASLGAGRSKEDARRLLDAARDLGINVIDTADTYGSTAAERRIGELTQADADRWVVVTKTGLPTVDLPGVLRVANQPAKKFLQRVRPEFHVDSRSLRRRIERSLQRLRRDRIDVFLLHLPPAGIETHTAVRDVLDETVRAGLVGEYGVSTNDIATLHAVREQWGRTCAETAVNPTSAASRPDAGLGSLDLIANHVMGAGVEPALSLRHAAAVPGVKVVLTGTSSLEHLRSNAAALEESSTSADLIV